ncbi:MAG TPA: tetratricopeptide repeat protein, partial [Sphingomicrobium sp.]|nr:tetratricopeptide repeat protein [Sphingomicrobium sp.]
MTDPSPGGPASASTLTGAAESALRAGDRTKAQLLLQEALAKSSDNADALTLMAWISEEDGRRDDAARFLRRAVAADPTPQRRLALASYLRRHWCPELAIEELEALPESVRSEERVALLYARALGQVGEHAKELASYR